MKKVLIVVDVQKGFMNNKNYLSLCTKIDNLLTKTHYDLVVLTKFVNRHGSMYEKHLNWKNLQSAQSQQFAITVPDNAVVFEKYGYGLNSFDLEKIKELSVDTVDICGLQTDACVYAISLQLFDNGIFPNVLINYTATDRKRTNIAKEMLIHQFGKVDEAYFE